MAKIYPVGYSLYGSEKYIEDLMSSSVMRLIDTRYHAYSWRPQWREQALRAKYGRRYRLAGRYLGNLNYALPDGWPIRIADIETGLSGLIRYLNEGHDLILLCQCVAYDNCHRKVIVEQLKVAMPAIEIVIPEYLRG